MDSVVHLRAAVSLLGRFPALAGVDLDVAPSEIVLVRGPNGAGKTTLLRLCAGLAHVSSGEAVVLGCDLARDPRAVRAPRRPARPRDRALRRPERRRQHPLLVASRRRAQRRHRGSDRAARPGRSPRDGCRSPGSLRVSAGGPPSRSWWPAVLSSGCSTSRTRASTRPAATSSTTSCAGRRRPAPPC